MEFHKKETGGRDTNVSPQTPEAGNFVKTLTFLTSSDWLQTLGGYFDIENYGQLFGFEIGLDKRRESFRDAF